MKAAMRFQFPCQFSWKIMCQLQDGIKVFIFSPLLAGCLSLFDRSWKMETVRASQKDVAVSAVPWVLRSGRRDLRLICDLIFQN